MKSFITVLSLGCVLMTSVIVAEETPKAAAKKYDPHALPEGAHELKIGDTAPDFSLPGIDGKTHTLMDYKNADVLMVVFLSNHCPDSQASEQRLIKFVDGQKGSSFAMAAINPNNPDGRVLSRAALLDLAAKLRRKGGLLVVDEAFMDVGPPKASLAADVLCGNIVVLRSFGKFFGLAGVRLGFAIAAEDIAKRLRAALGPWAVSGPAIAIGAIALADMAWTASTQVRLAQAAQRLDELLVGAGVDIVGGTPLFRLAQTPAAAALHETLGGAGILVRRFAEQPAWLRFGLPGDEQAWERLASALAGHVR